MRLLAGNERSSLPLDRDRLAQHTGKSVLTLYRHLYRLQEAGLLEWSSLRASLKVCFTAAGAPPTSLPAGAARS